MCHNVDNGADVDEAPFTTPIDRQTKTLILSVSKSKNRKFPKTGKKYS